MPEVDPPELDPPELHPPELDPPELDPPELDPPDPASGVGLTAPPPPPPPQAARIRGNVIAVKKRISLLLDLKISILSKKDSCFFKLLYSEI